MTEIFLQSVSPSIVSVFFHNIEVEILRDLNLNRITEFDGFFQFISNSVSYVSWGLTLFLLFFALIFKKIELKRKAVFLISTVSISSIISLILKYTIDRPRPFISYDFIEKLSVGGSPSFPSGHTAEATAFALAVCIIYPRWYIIIPSLTWAILVGYSRMSLGVHYPSDVLAGVIIGVLSAYLCSKSQKCLKELTV